MFICDEDGTKKNSESPTGIEPVSGICASSIFMKKCIHSEEMKS